MGKRYQYTTLHAGHRGGKTVSPLGPRWTLEQLQKAVDGPIEILGRGYEPNMSIAPRAKIFVNEEGKYRPDFEDNYHFDLVHTAGGRTWIDPVRGPAVIEEAYNA